jgi:hypothetical protein
MATLFEALALVATGLFAGAALSINLAEHPARLGLPGAYALAQRAPAYRRATATQASLALVAASSALIAWALGSTVALAHGRASSSLPWCPSPSPW